MSLACASYSFSSLELIHEQNKSQSHCLHGTNMQVLETPNNKYFKINKHTHTQDLRVGYVLQKQQWHRTGEITWGGEAGVVNRGGRVSADMATLSKDLREEESGSWECLGTIQGQRMMVELVSWSMPRVLKSFKGAVEQFFHALWVLFSLANKELMAYSEAGFSGREDGGRRKVKLWGDARKKGMNTLYWDKVLSHMVEQS